MEGNAEKGGAVGMPRKGSASGTDRTLAQPLLKADFDF